MPFVDPSELEGVNNPELVFGIVAPVGTPLKHIETRIEKALKEHGYDSEVIRLSNFLSGFSLSTAEPESTDNEYVRFSKLMSRGNELRQAIDGGEALALLAAAHIHSKRPDAEPRALSSRAFILHQLKNPDEVLWLHTIYGTAYQLIGVYCPESVRMQYLHVMRGMSQEEAEELIHRDKGEELAYGQHVTRTFHQSDVFLEMRGFDESHCEDIEDQIQRYLDLLFGTRIISPSRYEYGMFFAHSAALRSADLSRQVGASILTENGDLVSVGANEVPKSGGGQYWGEEGS